MWLVLGQNKSTNNVGIKDPTYKQGMKLWPGPPYARQCQVEPRLQRLRHPEAPHSGTGAPTIIDSLQ